MVLDYLVWGIVYMVQEYLVWGIVLFSFMHENIFVTLLIIAKKSIELGAWRV